MTTETRTRKSIKNSSAALVMYVVNLVLEFFSRAIFLKYLGTEILGLNTTANNILQFLNLTEMGVWTAIATSLYAPLHHREHDKINQIITFNGLIYRRIAFFIIGAAALVMCFFPFIFRKMELPLWYAYASFSVLLFSSLLGYFVNYRQFLLVADQQNYKVIFTYKVAMVMKIIAQICAMLLFPYPYLWWLGLEVIFTCIGSIALNIVVKKTYPFLKKAKHTYSELKSLYPEILVKIKQLFVQKISTYAIFQISPLIIYGIVNLTLVTLYGNYMTFIYGLISLLAAIFNNMIAGIGNLITCSNFSNVLNVFHQLFSFRFFIVGTCCFGLWIGGQSFICLWLGKQYLLPLSTLALLTIFFFLYANRFVVYDFLTAYGYFGDVWASIAEVIINIGLSIWLGIVWGLNGIISGILLSMIIIAYIWKPIYLFRIKLKNGFLRYWLNFFVLLLSGIIVWLLSSYLISFISIIPEKSILDFIIYTGSGCLIFAGIYAIILMIICPPFRKCIRRFI